jgi:RNA polymerase sigma-70 factor (ECF subfamily)
MADPDSTRWSLLRGAAEGESAAREEFARHYEPIIRAYLGARWRNSPLFREMDDAVQETFLACLKEGGALTRAEDDRPGGFRAFLYGIVRNVARQVEKRWGKREVQPDSRLHLSEIEAREEALSKVFDRGWAISLLRQALRKQAVRAREKGEHAVRRVELLRQRFQEGKPIRDIAKEWGVNANTLHSSFLTARREFRESLREVVREVQGGPGADVDAECARLAGYFE